jgi:hypothetical protein
VKLRLYLLLRVLVIILVFLALFLVYGPLWIPLRVSNVGPNVTVSIALLIIAILYISVSFYIGFADKTVKPWEKSLLLVGMIMGFFLFSFLGLFSAFDLGLSSPGFLQANPAFVNNLTLTTDLMFVTAATLFTAILGFTLIPRRESIVEWLKNYKEDKEHPYL